MTGNSVPQTYFPMENFIPFQIFIGNIRSNNIP